MHDRTALDSVAARRLPPALPLVLALAAVLAAILTPVASLVALLGLFPSCVLLLHGRESRARLARRALGISPIVLSTVGVRIACAPGLTAISVLGITTTREALAAGGSLALRIGVAALWTTWLTTTAASEIERGLLQLGVPAGLVTLFALTRRFGAQLTTTLEAAWAAVALRGGFRSWRALGRTAGLLAGVVVVRSLDRSHRVGVALALRGGVGR
ncbi:MAG: hypothetical protein NVSMB47_11960 [Polyangiales bacterium]